MARPLRHNFAGGWYHVTARRWKRETMFLDARDHCHFLDLLKDLKERYTILIHAYALMGNHYHLLLETPCGNLSRAMQWLNVSYGMWHNRRWRETGPLIQGRYHSVPVEGEGAWSLELSRYIHLNPVRTAALGQGKKSRRAQAAGFEEGPSDERRCQMVTVLRTFPWSSYQAYAGYASRPDWLTCDVLWERNAKQGGADQYRQWLEGTILQGAEETWTERMNVTLALGSEEFRKRLSRIVKGNPREQPEMKRWKDRPGFDVIKRSVEKAKGERWEDFVNRHGDPGRDMALYLARRHSGLTIPEIAALAGVEDHRAAGKAIERMGVRIRRDVKLRSLYEKVSKQMSEVGT